MPGSYDETRAAMRAEARAVRRWLAQNAELMRDPQPDDRVISFGSADDLDSWAEGTGRGGSVLAGMSGVSLSQLDAQQRVAHCLSFLKPKHRELLRARFMEGRTLEDIAADEGVSRQAIHQRLATAEAEFIRAVGEHWLDLSTLRIEEL